MPPLSPPPPPSPVLFSFSFSVSSSSSSFSLSCLFLLSVSYSFLFSPHALRDHVIEAVSDEDVRSGELALANLASHACLLSRMHECEDASVPVWQVRARETWPSMLRPCRSAAARWRACHSGRPLRGGKIFTVTTDLSTYWLSTWNSRAHLCHQVKRALCRNVCGRGGAVRPFQSPATSQRIVSPSGILEYI